jgi:hypothetical protein
VVAVSCPLVGLLSVANVGAGYAGRLE